MIGALLVAGGVTAIIVHIATVRRCMVVVDARADDIKVKQYCDMRNGRVILVAGEKTKIELKDIPVLFDFTDVAKAVVEKGAEAAKAVAEAAGATAEVLPDDTALPED